MASDKEVIADAREAFKEAEEAEADNRKRWIDDMRFSRLHEQWPEEVARQRELERRPCLTIPRLQTFVRQVVNDARLNKPAIKVHPVDDNADVETAKVLNGLIRNIEMASRADVAYDTAIDFAVSGGLGYIRVDVDYADDDTFDMDIKIERVINPLTVYGDPHSHAADGSDWNVAFETETLTKDQFERRWKGADKVDWEVGYSDERDATWVSDDGVRIADYWTREEVDRTIVLLSDGQVLDATVYERQKDLFDALGVGVVNSRSTKSHKVRKRIVTAAEVLADEEWTGRYIPLIPVYGEEIIIEGERHYMSLIHAAKDAQRNLNYWRSAAAELVALAPKAPFIGRTGAFVTDAAKWQTANTVSHAYIEYDSPEPPMRQPFAGPPAGAIQEALNASDDLKAVIGMYDASLGARSNEVSGRAIMARQREGDVSTFHFIDNLSRSIRQVGHVVLDLIPHVYTDARVVRVLGEDEQPTSVKVNQPVPVMGQDGQPVMQEDPQTGERKPATRIYDLTTGKYDVAVKAGPSFTSKREEAATQMIELIRVHPAVGQLIGDLLAKNLDWPEADEIARRLKALLPPQVQNEDPRIKQMQQVIQQGAQRIKELESDRQIKLAELQLKSREIAIKEREFGISKFEAETDRIEAVGKVRTDAMAAAQSGPQQQGMIDGRRIGGQPVY